MKVLAIERPVPGIGPERFTASLGRAEAARVWELEQAGVVRETYFRADESSAVLVLECADLEEAEQALQSLPLVASGLIRFEILGLRPYPGFARLFAPAAVGKAGDTGEPAPTERE